MAEDDLSPVEAAVADLLERLAFERTYAQEADAALDRAKGEPEQKAGARRDMRRATAGAALARVVQFLQDPRIVAFCPDVREAAWHCP